MSRDNIEAYIDILRATVGFNTDDENSNTLFGGHYVLQKHIHGIQKTYPYLADGIVLTGGVGAWQLGNKIEIIPANTILSPFDIHSINTGFASAADTYQIVFYQGSAGNEIFSGTSRVLKEAAQSSILTKHVISPLFAANTRISMAIASKSGGSDTLTVSLEYHEY